MHHEVYLRKIISDKDLSTASKTAFCYAGPAECILCRSRMAERRPDFPHAIAATPFVLFIIYNEGTWNLGTLIFQKVAFPIG